MNASKQFEKDFVDYIKANPIKIKSGIIYSFEWIFRTYYNEDQISAITTLLKLLQKYIKDDIIVQAILHTISHFTYDDEICDKFIIDLINLVHHENKVIKKFALKVFDNWNSIHTLKALKSISPIKEEWLEEYRCDIIKRLESLPSSLSYKA